MMQNGRISDDDVVMAEADASAAEHQEMELGQYEPFQKTAPCSPSHSDFKVVSLHIPFLSHFVSFSGLLLYRVCAMLLTKYLIMLLFMSM